LSSLHPFAVQIDERMTRWRGLVKRGHVSWDRVEDATEEMDITVRGFEAMVDAAIAEGWSPAELRLLKRVYKDLAGPYREAWTALMTTWAKSAADTQGERRLRLVADQTVRRLDEAKEVLSAAA
jgi:hypothetical protein